MSGYAMHRGHPRGQRLAVALLAGAIVTGSMLLWLGIPAGWLWIVAHLSDEYPTIYVLALLGCPFTMIAFGLLIGRINAAYLRLSGAMPPPRHTAWLKSLSGERTSRRPRTLLEASMTVSVIAALLVMAVWFFLYASNYGPPLGS